MNFLKAKQIYMIGIKGAGMTALAEFLVRQGIHVTGSDTEEVFFTDAILKRLKIEVKSPFQVSNLDVHADCFIYSTAYRDDNNVEMQAARATGKPLLSYPEALGILTENRLTIAVCGTHGKTTTSALLAETMQASHLEPSAIVGSEIKSWQGSALAGDGQYLVIEADEYQDKLRFYTPLGVILTSVDWDHPDFFPTVQAYEATFTRFLESIPRHGFLVASGDQARVRAVAEVFHGATLFYGFLPENDVQIVDWSSVDPESEAGKQGIRQQFSLRYLEKRYGPFSLTLSGKHNAENAAAVFSTFVHLKFPMEALATAWKHFSGTKRRFEYIGEANQALVFDDYAHHPEEIRVTLEAFRSLYPERTLTVVFHPHTYTRTKALLGEFAEALGAADQVIILDIYGSAREAHGGVSAEDVVKRINQAWPSKARYGADRTILVTELGATLGKNDLVVTMGAGDVWQIAEALVGR